MASFYHITPDPDSMVRCPYDEVHMVRWKKLPYHLMKCRKNNPNRKMVTCHFNARHTIPEEEFRIHLSICPDRHEIERMNGEQNSSNWVKGNCDVPTYFPDNVIMPDPDEDWETETIAPMRIGVPARDMAGIGYYKSLAGFKPSQKKAYYNNLRKGDTEANVRLMESLGTFSIADNERRQVEEAAEAKIVTIPQPIQPAAPVPAPITSFAQPVAVGRGRGRGSAISRAAAAPVTPGGLSVSSKTENEEPSDPVSTAKAIRRTRKKLAQIDHLVERQKMGETLNEEERVKVALKTTLINQLTKLEAKAQAEQ